MAISSRRLTSIGCLCVPALVAAGDPKCFDYEPQLDPAANVEDVEESGGEADSGGGVVPAMPCPSAGTAQLIVQNFAYNIECGCVETEGRTCTVSAGTVVRWSFADSEEHNVTSLRAAFGISEDMLAGQYEHTFAQVGEFGYGCSIHPNDMSDYHIVVR